MHHITLLTIICKEYQEILKDNLIGIYIHGSIAFGCFNQDTSDIDFIVVVKKSLNQTIKL